jgi:hypothetical protein
LIAHNISQNYLKNKKNMNAEREKVRFLSRCKRNNK